MMPAWQKRQPCVQPRWISMAMRSWTVCRNGTIGFVSAGGSSCTKRFVTRAGSPSTSGVTAAIVPSALYSGCVEARDVDAPDLRELLQHLLARAAALALPLAHEVDESTMVSSPSPRTKTSTKSASASGLSAPMPPQMIKRVGVGALVGAHGEPREVEHVEDVRVRALVLSEKPMTSNSRQRVARLEAPERHAFGAHHRFHVRPGREDALGEHAVAAVDDVVEDAEAHVRHADVVEVGVGEGDAHVAGVPVLDDGVPLAAGVAGRLLDAGEQAIRGCAALARYVTSRCRSW